MKRSICSLLSWVLGRTISMKPSRFEVPEIDELHLSGRGDVGVGAGVSQGSPAELQETGRRSSACRQRPDRTGIRTRPISGEHRQPRDPRSSFSFVMQPWAYSLPETGQTSPDVNWVESSKDRAPSFSSKPPLLSIEFLRCRAYNRTRNSLLSGAFDLVSGWNHVTAKQDDPYRHTTQQDRLLWQTLSGHGTGVVRFRAT